jgi:membrane protease YdiL (CAAX protease family)
MTNAQKIMGWLYLPFYLVLTSSLIQFLGRVLGANLTEYAVNVLYFSINLVFVLLVFHRFLLKSLRGFTEHFWLFVQTLILGFALYYIGNLLVVSITGMFTALPDIANNSAVADLISHNSTAMLLFSVIAAPVVEETLVRGVVFGSFHRVNRYLAYVMSILLFSVMHVWQFASDLSIPVLIYNGVAYIPASVALGWTYEKSGTILCPIVLHAIINAIAFGVTLAF